MYDTQNIFAKILRQEIPCKKIAEGEHFLSFYDIAPHAKIHALVIPKGRYLNFDDFIRNATPHEIHGFQQGLLETLKILDVLESGYRLVANAKEDGGQLVPHYHVHILAGEKLGGKLNA